MHSSSPIYPFHYLHFLSLFTAVKKLNYFDTSSFSRYRSLSHTHSSSSSILFSFSMKLVKSILSPVRVTRDFSFLSRRLRRKKASFFGKKATGGGFESHEPSSPKVTCIGQVRVKSKRKARQCRSLSRRRSGSGEVSFRHQQQQQAPPQECLSHRNQRWVHLPVCEAMRELSCFLTCSRSCSCSCSCCCSNPDREVGCCGCRNVQWSGCGAVFCRWLVCVGDCGRGGKREIEVVVREEEESRRRRNHVFEDIEVRDGRIQVKGEEIARVSISIPPKNALLLMRCRSDPIKMAALANRINWAAPLNYEEEDDDDAFEGQTDEILEVIEQEQEREKEEEEILEESGTLELGQDEKEDVESNMSSFEALLDHDNNTDPYHSNSNEEQHNPQETEEDKGSASPSPHTSIKAADEDDKDNKTNQDDDMEIDHDPGAGQDESQQVNESSVLPECLLLMMCEPKLSMEVSKETWVRGTDFIRWLPPRKPARPANSACCHHHPEAKRKQQPPPPGLAIAEPKPAKPAGLPKKTDPQQQPARSSCSLVVEHKMSNGGVYEPLVLTRCKSEPMRTAAAKLMPEPGSRKDTTLQMVEPHRLAGVSVAGAAGVS